MTMDEPTATASVHRHMTCCPFCHNSDQGGNVSLNYSRLKNTPLDGNLALVFRPGHQQSALEFCHEGQQHLPCPHLLHLTVDVKDRTTGKKQFVEYKSPEFRTEGLYSLAEKFYQSELVDTYYHPTIQPQVPFRANARHVPLMIKLADGWHEIQCDYLFVFVEDAARFCDEMGLSYVRLRNDRLQETCRE